MSDLRRLASSTWMYGLIGVASALMSAVVVPIYSRTFVPAQYGVVSLVTATAALLAAFAVLGLDSATARWFNLTASEHDRRTTVASWVAAYLAMTAIAALLLVSLAGPLARPLTASGQGAAAIRWAGAALPLGAPAAVALTVLRLQERRAATVSVGLCLAIVSTGSAALLVTLTNVGPQGVFIGQCIGATTASALAIYFLRGWLNPALADRGRLRAMLPFALPLVPAAAAAWIANLLDRYVVRAASGAHQVGVYQVAYSLAAITALATTAFQLAWGPFAFSIAERANARETYARVMLGYIAVAGWLAAAVGAFAPAALSVLVPADYRGAAVAVPALSMSYVLIGLTYVAAIGPSIAGTSSPVAMGTILAGLLTVPLLATLVPAFGVEGAAVATVVAWAVQPAWVFWRGDRIWHVPYEYSRAITMLVLAMAVGQVLNLWRHGSVVVVDGGKAIALIGLAAALALGARVGLRTR